VSADDDAVANTIAHEIRKGDRHERRGFADGNDAQRFAFQERGNRRILYGAIDQMVWRGSFDCAARNAQEMLTETQGRNLS
jgi:hypothetical protein